MNISHARSLFGGYAIIASVFLLIASVYFSHPTITNAIGQAACACQDQDSNKPLYCITVACADATNGFKTTGMCAHPGICAGTATSDGTLGSIGQLLSGIAALMKAMQSTPSADSGMPTYSTPTCPNGNYTVTIPSTDPCAIYQPPAATTTIPATIDISTSTPTASPDLGGTPGDPSAGVSIGGGGSIKTATTTGTQMQPQGNGIHGDLKVDTVGVTAFASNQDQANNFTVAAFYGVDATGGQTPGMIASQMCMFRPWAGNFLASVAPAAFFDALCKLHGYQVGLPAPVIITPAVVPVVQHPATTTPPAPPIGYTGPNVPPEVKVWAVPSSVALGARTSIFWSTQGVYNCTVTSPDGSFNQKTVSGGASTVPLTADTTFTISCLKPDNTPDTAYTVVKLAL
jgi:hypothetical protein